MAANRPGDCVGARQSTPERAIESVYAALNDRDRAFLWLNRAIDAREWFLGMVKADPLLDPLRADSRFGALLQRVGLEP